MRGPFGEEGYYSRDVTGKTVGLLVSFVCGLCSRWMTLIRSDHDFQGYGTVS